MNRTSTFSATGSGATGAGRSAAVQRYQENNMKNLKNLDDVVNLASKICDAPIAYISLIDDENQVYIAKRGLEIEAVIRSQSFCNETVQQDDLIVIDDISKHPVYCKSPSVESEPYLRFYAGMPVKTYEGQNVGTLCVIDVKPKKLNAHQREGLKMLSSHVVYLLELRVALNVVAEQKKIVDSDALLMEKFKAQNEQVKSMAKFLAHQVSGPVATMKGLIQLIDSLALEESREYVPLMDLVVQQMDEAVRLVAASAFEAIMDDPE